MKQIFAKTENVNRFVAAMNRLRNAGEKIPRMALVYGKYGTGRSETMLWYLAQHPDEAIYIRVIKIMNAKWLLGTIISELGQVPEVSKQKRWDQLVEILMQTPRILFFDEIDYLAKDPDVIETLRDIHDMTRTPIVFVGMEHAEKKLKRYAHLWDRFSEILQFEDLTEADVQTIADTICEVKISTDAVKYLYSTGVNRFRPLLINLYKAEAISRANGLKEITAQHLREVRK